MGGTEWDLIEDMYGATYSDDREEDTDEMQGTESDTVR